MVTDGFMTLITGVVTLLITGTGPLCRACGRQVCTQQHMVLIICDLTAAFLGKGSAGARDFEYGLAYFHINLTQPTDKRNEV